MTRLAAAAPAAVALPIAAPSACAAEPATPAQAPAGFQYDLGAALDALLHGVDVPV